MREMSVCVIYENLEWCINTLTPCRNINRLGQLRFFKSFRFQWIHYELSIFFPWIYVETFLDCFMTEIFLISVPLTHHYKKCPVIWMIIGLISQKFSVSPKTSRNVSSYVRMYLWFFYIYISMGSSLNWAVSFKIYFSPLTTMLVRNF